jgi:uncharacterized protein YxeA
MTEIIIGLVVVVCAAIIGILIYRNNQKEADALIANAKKVADQVEALKK